MKSLFTKKVKEEVCSKFYLTKSISRIFATLMFILSFGINATATHVVGGGITYQQLENDNYLITVKLYADCSPTTANIPNNVNVTCRRGPDGTNPAPYGSFVLPRISRDTLSPDVPSCTFDPGICVEEAIYQDIVTLPAGIGGYHLYYTVCCRNGTIANIVNPLNAAETFYAYVPDRYVYLNNSSPSFNDSPPIYVCAGDDLNLDFSASDPDGDQLVYSFYTPYDGQNNGGVNFGPGLPPNNINISPVTWQGGFGDSDPLDAAPGLLPGLTISNAGIISGIPPAPGQYVVGVMIDEYRNGVLIGRITRDFQFNVLNCPPPNAAGIDVVTNCNGLDVDFINTSTGLLNDYWWDFGTANPADSSNAFEPSFTFPAAGTYDVMLIVEKELECADTIVYQLSVMNPIDYTVDVDSISCNGLLDGAATGNAIDLNYVYNWSTNQTGNSINNLPLGNYWVYATNTIGCVDTQTFIIEQPLPLDIQFIGTDPLCFNSEDGSLEAIVTGGTGPFAYFWPSENVSTNPLMSISAGAYDVEVTDANGCFLEETGGINNPSLLTTQVTSQSMVNCFGGADGAVTVTAYGGSPNYFIDWLTLPNDAFTMNNLAAGSYVAEVTDVNGCLATLVVDIAEPDSLIVDAVVINEETCTGSNGQILADVEGGIGVMTFMWNPLGQTTAVVSNLSAGNYSVQVTDENGCQDNAAVVLYDNPTGAASVGNTTPVSCENGNDGTVDIAMNGGSAPFQYNYSCNCANNSSLTGLDAGYYWVEVTDANGCVDTLDFEISETAPLNVSATATTTPSCNGDANGEIETQTTGGTAPFSYNWNSGQTTEDINNLPAAMYTVTVTDDNGCTNELSIQLDEPDALVADGQILGNIICFGDSAGIANVIPSGGTAPYAYLWSNFETTQLIDSLPAGHYQVTLTDANNCQTTAWVDIIEYDEVTAEIVYDDGFCPGDDVTFTVLTNGLNNQYDYYWLVDDVLSGQGNTFTYAITDTTEVMINLINTGNCPTVKDTAVVGPIFMQPNNVSVQGTPDTICFGATAMIQGIILNTDYITSMFWNDTTLLDEGPHMITPEMASEYIFTIENVCGEQQSGSTFINVFLPPAAAIFANGASGCDRIDVDFGYNYVPTDYSLEAVTWTINGQIYDLADPSITYTYSSMVQATAHLTFSNGCTFDYSDELPVEVFESPEANFYFNPDPAIQHEVTEFVDISHGNPKVWEWYLEGEYISDEERPSHIFDETGEYWVQQIIFNEYGCSDTMEHFVEVIGTFTVYVPNAFTPDGNSLNNSFKPVMIDVVPDNYEFLIFNRWGEVIFRTDDLEGDWDGTFQGENVADGVYIWKILVTDNVGLEHEYVGNVTLLR